MPYSLLFPGFAEDWGSYKLKAKREKCSMVLNYNISTLEFDSKTLLIKKTFRVITFLFELKLLY